MDPPRNKYYKLIPRGFCMLKTKKLILGCLLSVTLTVLMLMILSFITKNIGLLTEKAASVLTMSTGILAVLVSAICTAKMAGEKGLLHGAILALGYVLLYVIAAWIQKGNLAVNLMIIRAIAFLIAGTLGGIIGVSGKNKVQF